MSGVYIKGLKMPSDFAGTRLIIYPNGQVLFPHRTYFDELHGVEAIPAADVVPVVRGEWIVCGDGDNVPYMCSHCGKTTPAVLIQHYPCNYCPNCGALMDKDGDA